MLSMLWAVWADMVLVPEEEDESAEGSNQNPVHEAVQTMTRLSGCSGLLRFQYPTPRALSHGIWRED
jgi:hypothetical protein